MMRKDRSRGKGKEKERFRERERDVWDKMGGKMDARELKKIKRMYGSVGK